jgi:hypothetical protein
MLLRICLLAFIVGWFSVNGLVPVPPIYRKAASALKSYTSNPSYNPIVYSLINVFIHDKRARAFISDQALELALTQIKELDQTSQTTNEKLLRQLIYGINCKHAGKNCSLSHRQKINRPAPHLKQQIVLALDKFFGDANSEDEWPTAKTDENKN